MLDVGANVDCTAQHLLQFAIMGNEYGQHLFGKPNPRVGLLSIGEEDSKGNEVTKEAFKLLRAVRSTSSATSRAVMSTAGTRMSSCATASSETSH